MMMAMSVGNGSAAFAQGWESYPWVSLFAGYENDRLLDQGAVPVVVPGGNFVDLRSGILLSRTLSPRTRLNLDAVASFERFDNDENRRLLGASANAEVRRRFGALGRWRLTLGANYFGDSVQEEIDRFRLGAEAAAGITGRRGFLEAIAGAQGRRFPNFTTPDETSALGTYTEMGALAGLNGAVRPWRRLELSGYVTVQGTQARDPALDSRMLLAQLGVRLGLVGRLDAFGSAMTQERVYTAAQPGTDTDTYRQLGVGLAWSAGRHFDVFARFAWAEYTDVLGITDDIERYSVGITWWPGGHGVREVRMQIPLTAVESSSRVRAGEPHRFAHDAPGAGRVSVVGDFNGWDPTANPMRAAGDGHWETEIALPAGSWQYAYWVDGVLVTPPEARVKMDDGFGGRNGLIQVEASNR